MSCRIHRETVNFEPIQWNSIGGTDQVNTPRQPGAAAAAGDLERKLREVTNSAEQRVRDAKNEGFNAGRQAAATELEPVIAKLSQAIADAATFRAKLRKQTEGDLVKLALGIAQRVLHRELQIDSEALGGIVNTVLERLEARDLLRVRLHPSHESAIRKHLEAAHISGCELVADRSLQPGDVFFDTARGTLDASIGGQLKEIERGLCDRLSA